MQRAPAAPTATLAACSKGRHHQPHPRRPAPGTHPLPLNPQGQGLSAKQLALCDGFVYIPQYGAGTASLNVAVAASIVLHHFALWAGYRERAREVGRAGWLCRRCGAAVLPLSRLLQVCLVLCMSGAPTGAPLLLLLQGQKYVLDERPQRTAPRGCVPLTPEEQAAERARRAAAAAPDNADAADLPDLFD